VRDAGTLAGTLLDADADVGAATRATRTLARSLTDAGLPRTARAGRAVSDELLRQDRLRRVLVRANAVLGEARARDLVAKGATAASLVPAIADLQQRTLSVQERTLTVVARNLEVAEETARDARRAADAAERLDRKTGGRPPTG